MRRVCLRSRRRPDGWGTHGSANAAEGGTIFKRGIILAITEATVAIIAAQAGRRRRRSPCELLRARAADGRVARAALGKQLVRLSKHRCALLILRVERQGALKRRGERVEPVFELSCRHDTGLRKKKTSAAV